VNDDRRLRDKLARLAAADDGRPEAAGDPLRAILLEIDETVLPRTLVFRAPDGAALVLEVANRRLQAVVSLPHDVAPDTDGDRVAGPLPPDDAGALAAVAAALRGFARLHGGFTVAAEPLDRGLDASGLGRSATALAEALGLDLYDAPEPVPMPDPARGFEAGLARLALATAAVADGTASAATGPDADAVRRLSSLREGALAALLAHLGPPAARAGRFVVMAGADEALFIGQTEAARAVAALLPADHAGALVALWHATRGET
jgi:hypothetical protein